MTLNTKENKKSSKHDDRETKSENGNKNVLWEKGPTIHNYSKALATLHSER